MENVEIILDAEGIENELTQMKKDFKLEMDYDSQANFDGIVCCTIVGTLVNVGMFLMQAYSLWGDKRIALKTKDLEVNEIAISKVIEYLKSQNNL